MAAGIGDEGFVLRWSRTKENGMRLSRRLGTNLCFSGWSYEFEARANV
jgi:hypothetical protein